MKIFFCQEHLDLDMVGGLAKADSSLNHTALLTQQSKLIKDLEARLKLNLVETLREFANKYKEETPPDNIPDQQDEFASALSTISGNSTKQTDQMMKLFHKLCKKVDDLASQKSTPTTTETNKENINPRTGKQYRRHCWTHGCCDHWSNWCPKRKQGHKLNATFKNCMGGSTEGVLGA